MVDSELLDAGMCEVGSDDGENFDGRRSSIVHHYVLQSHLVEGRRLLSETPLPSKENRILYSVLDLHSGEDIYCAHANGRVDSEPDLQSIVPNETRPYLMVSWLVVG